MKSRQQIEKGVTENFIKLKNLYDRDKKFSQTTGYLAFCKSFLLLLILGSLVSCEKNRVYEKNISIDKYSWDSKMIPSFKVEITDTASLYNIYVNIRHADLYPFQNIWLQAGTQFPDGTKTNRRIEIMLANDEGKWYGEGLGDIWDFRSLVQENAFFNKPGTYTFTLTQNMRQDPLPGIMAVGLRVENMGMNKKAVGQ
ncbi:MAG: gliding motility lipoprotein GldH [Chitinophagales bacterium]